MKFRGRVGGGGTHFYAILGCTAVQGMVLDPSALNRDFSEIEDSIIFVPYTHCPDTGI